MRSKNAVAVRFPTKKPQPKLTRSQIKAIEAQRQKSAEQTRNIVARFRAVEQAEESLAIAQATIDANNTWTGGIDPAELEAITRRADARARGAT